MIAGAGLGGLTVAAALARAPDGPRVVVIDPRTRWDNDRTWCFWVPPGDPSLALAAHRWDRWSVSAGGRRVVRSAAGEVYAQVSGDRVYRDALDAIAACPRVVLRRGRVVSTEVGEAGATVVLEDGAITAATVVDTRPPALAHAPAAHERRLLQHFVGWHVRTDRACFDPDVVSLMEFEPSDSVHFTYVLPYTPTEALVEDTWFGAEVHPDATYADALTAWLTARAGRWEVLRTEQGVLPMTTERFDPHPSPREWRVGLAGGAARPATGYAFVATRHMAQAVADRVLTGSTAPLRPLRSERTELLDGVFLEWMHSAPQRAPEAFLRLFDRVDPGVLVRFLSNRSSVADDLRVMAALAPVAGPTMLRAVRARM